MIERAPGLILRTRPFTETSLIVHWLTPGFGRLSTIAKGARRPKSPLRGKLDLFYEGDFSFHRSRHSDLHALREVVLREIHAPLRRELAYLQQASCCSALIEQSTEAETPLPEIFELMRGFLAALPSAPPQPQALFSFKLKLLNELGLSPDPAQSRLTAGANEIVKMLARQDWTSVLRLRLSPAQVAEISRFLHNFWTFHLGKIPAEL